jgi:hypothetical protein
VRRRVRVTISETKGKGCRACARSAHTVGMEKYVLIIPISCARSAHEIGTMRMYVMICKRIGRK